MEEKEGAGTVLDKPNAHRAIDLAVHTIPTFVLAGNCSGMVFELMHQVFKRCLEKNTHDTSTSYGCGTGARQGLDGERLRIVQYMGERGQLRTRLQRARVAAAHHRRGGHDFR